MTKRGLPIMERFFLHVDIVDEDNACWIWTGSKNRGYGRFGAEGKTTEAYRWLWEQENGKVPEGLELDHLCSTYECVRPSHLEPVTHRENMRRTRRDSCKHGHAFTKENTYVYNGNRYCRACRNNRSRVLAESRRRVRNG